MFGISPLGWVHTLGSLPAIPVAIYMFARYGRIVPRSGLGLVYFVTMFIGAATVFLIARDGVGYVIGAVTLVLLFVGYAAGSLPLGAANRYIETISLSLTAFLLMVPTVTEILTRVPDGHPFASGLDTPLVRGAHATLLAILVVGLTAQIIYLRRRTDSAPA